MKDAKALGLIQGAVLDEIFLLKIRNEKQEGYNPLVNKFVS